MNISVDRRAMIEAVLIEQAYGCAREIRFVCSKRKMSYISCHHKKSRPKVGIEVCRKCRRMKTCSDYADYVQPSLFSRPSSSATGRKAKRVRKEEGSPRTKIAEGDSFTWPDLGEVEESRRVGVYMAQKR